jgi:hypothetical protein
LQTVALVSWPNTFKSIPASNKKKDDHVIYKYLNVVCRKFVIDYDVKKLYIDGKLEEVTTDSVKSELFITKAETTMLERKCNQFIRVGSIHDYNDKKNIKLIKEIDILDFLKSCKTNTEY